ncbi:MAG TPA: hypothetical protein VK203_09170, partial [Nostocaceae cyanobacterium]|nr:hypothetical protein [Nostocaceae cyanobacterium]
AEETRGRGEKRHGDTGTRGRGEKRRSDALTRRKKYKEILPSPLSVSPLPASSLTPSRMRKE